MGSIAINRKLPLLGSHLKLLTDQYKFATLDYLQILTMVSLDFVLLLKWDDLNNLNNLRFFMTVWQFSTLILKGRGSSDC